ncbi:TcpQ domain-containing protein [uncultured Stenotrophomonas sp.]|uniref:TcpQ domain-containing protein n=1 Tax=uncultured Stenotrophomonas sp. TaxID=165438 RepID=UPI0025FC9FB2|nr:TcpQ domain-containing protein [uncultured Stenotrophomonas sp.]
MTFRAISRRAGLLLLGATAAVAAAPCVAAPGTAATAEDDGFVLVEAGSYVPPPAPMPKPKLLRQWKVPANTSLRQVLATWAKEEGWEIYWPKVDPTTDLVTEVEVNFGAANFEDAVTKFANGLPPEVGIAVTFNRANSPKLLHVSESTRRQTVVSDQLPEAR